MICDEANKFSELNSGLYPYNQDPNFIAFFFLPGQNFGGVNYAGCTWRVSTPFDGVLPYIFLNEKAAYLTLAHEIGHCLGLADPVHDTRTNNLMFGGMLVADPKLDSNQVAQTLSCPLVKTQQLPNTYIED